MTETQPTLDDPMMAALNGSLSAWFAMTPTAELRAILTAASHPSPSAALAGLADVMGAESVTSVVVSLVGAIYSRRLRDEAEGA